MLCNTHTFEDEMVQSYKETHMCSRDRPIVQGIIRWLPAWIIKRHMRMPLSASQMQTCLFDVTSSGCRAKNASNRYASTGQLQIAYLHACCHSSFACVLNSWLSHVQKHNSSIAACSTPKHPFQKRVSTLGRCFTSFKQCCHHLAGPDQRHVTVSQKHRPR